MHVATVAYFCSYDTTIVVKWFGLIVCYSIYLLTDLCII